jgi:hypothetical protein
LFAAFVCAPVPPSGQERLKQSSRPTAKFSTDDLLLSDSRNLDRTIQHLHHLIYPQSYHGAAALPDAGLASNLGVLNSRLYKHPFVGHSYRAHLMQSVAGSS